MMSSQLASSGFSSLTPLPLCIDALSPKAMLKAELSLFEIYSGEEVLSCIEISLESSLLLGIDLNGKSGDDGTDVWVPLSSEVRRVGEL